MSNIHPFPSEDKTLEQASTWLAKIDRGLSEQELAQYRAWIEVPKNRDMLFKMAQLWDKMNVLERLSDLFPEKDSATTSFYKPAAIAASILFASVFGFFTLQSVQPEQSSYITQTIESEKRYSTEIGEHAEIMLADGSEMKLNTNSLVKVTYTDKQRIFELEQGEMHITVAHNKQKPLTVFAGGQIIQAVGTAFNVELQGDQAELLVTDGRVLVKRQDKDWQNPIKLPSVHLPVGSMSVTKGHKVALNTPSEPVTLVSPSDLQAALSWQQGNLIFRGESLQDALDEVSRYSNYRFEYQDESIKHLSIAGLFKTNDIDSLLAALEENFDVSYQRDNKTIMLSKAQSTH